MTRTRSSAAPRARKVAAGGMTPCGDYVLVALEAGSGEDWEKSPSGLHLPPSARPDANIKRGVVKAISPHVTKAKFGVAVGDTVLISKFARTEEVGSGRVLVHAESITAVMPGGGA